MLSFGIEQLYPQVQVRSNIILGAATRHTLYYTLHDSRIVHLGTQHENRQNTDIVLSLRVYINYVT